MTATGDAVTAAIQARRRAGRPAIGLFLVPGFPDWAASDRAVRLAADRGVAFVEFPVVANGAWSARTGSCIASVLSGARNALCRDSERLDEWLRAAPCPVGVVYDGAWPSPCDWRAPACARRAARALLFETDPPDRVAAIAQARRWHLPIVPTVDGASPQSPAERAARLRGGGGFVYVSIGPRTGACGFTADRLRAVVRDVRARRPELPVMCAFGIRHRGDAACVLRASGADGVIVGTAALAQLRRGIRAFERWLDGLVAVSYGTASEAA